MKLELKVYDRKGKEVEKSYETDTYSLMFGTMEDFLEVINLDAFTGNGNKTELAAAVTNLIRGGMDKFKPLLMDVFDGITEDELRRCRVADLVKVVIKIVNYSIDEIKGAATGKN